MRKIYIALLIAIVCGGCTSRRQADGEPLYVSILPLRSLVQGIVGDVSTSRYSYRLERAPKPSSRHPDSSSA